MDWAQYFAEFMEKMPGGYILLGLIGGGVCLAPFIPKIMAAYQNYKKVKREAKEEEEARQKQAEEERLQSLLEEREFRKSVNDILSAVPEMTKRIEQLAKQGDHLIESEKNATKVLEIVPEITQRMDKLSEQTNTMMEAYASRAKTAGGIPEMIKKIDALTKANEHLMSSEANTINVRKDILGSIDNLGQKVENMDETIKAVGRASEEGDKKLHAAIGEIQSNVSSVTSRVEMIVESDLDDFRNYLIDMYDRHVSKEEPVTKKEIETFCMKFRKYRNEGGNGWGERLYYQILQCKTADGVKAEDIADSFNRLMLKSMEHHANGEHEND